MKRKLTFYSKTFYNKLFNKNTKLIFSLILFHLTFQSHAQKQVIDKTDSYELLVPNLDILHTNISFSKEDELSEIVAHKTDSTTITIIGEHITEKTLFDHLGTNALKETLASELIEAKRYRNDNEPLITNLEIYSDIFTLDKSIWLPEINVKIHSREVNFNNKSFLKTSPLPWKEDKTNTTQLDGLKAGDITIISKQHKDLNLIANGSNGAGIQFPDITYNGFDRTKFKESFEVYRCYPYLDENWGDCSKKYKLNYPAVGYYLTNTDSKCKRKRPPIFVTNFKELKWDGKTFDRLKETNVIDDDANNRLKYNYRTPSKAGKRGILNIVSETSTTYKYSNYEGKRGGYFKPKNTLDTKYIKLLYLSKGDYIKSSIRLQQDYAPVIFKADNVEKESHWGRCDDFELKNKWQRAVYHEYMDDPKGRNSFKDFKKRFSQYRYDPKDNLEIKNYSSTAQIYSYEHVSYSPSIKYLNHLLILEKNKFKDYHNLSSQDQKKLANKLKKLNTETTNAIIDYKEQLKKLSDKDDIDFINFRISEINKFKRELDIVSERVNKVQYLDEFDNPLGYRPIYSFSGINSFIKDGINEHLAYYISADKAAKTYQEEEEFKKQIPSLIENLDTVINENYVDLKKNQEELDLLGIEGEGLAKEAKELQEKLKKKEEELLEKAKGEAQREKYLRIGSKTLATAGACVATAYGGPSAGSVAYSMVDKLTNAGLDATYSKDDGVESTLRNVDIVPALDLVRKDQLSPVQKELNDLEYRKNNGLFNNFKDWKVDSTNNYVTSKIPESLEQYRKKKKELSGKISKLKEKDQKYNAMANFSIKGGEEIYSTFVKTSYLDKAIDRVTRQSQEYKLIAEDIKYNAYKNGQFALRLREQILNKGNITKNIYDFAQQKHDLKQIQLNKEAYSDPLLGNKINHIRNQSLEDLKWMEYQLIKTYNYTTLEPYPDNTTNYRLLFSNYLNSNLSPKKKLDTLKYFYKQKLDNIRLKIIKEPVMHHQDGEDTTDEFIGEKIYLTKEATPKILDYVNSGKTYVIDLYNDFNDAIIEPDKNNIRVLKFQLEDFQLSRKLKNSEKIKIAVTFGEEGILRNNEKLFLFKDDKNAIEKWSWTLTASNKSNEQAKRSNTTQKSKMYEDMMDYLLKGSDRNRAEYKNLFTLKPAWSKIKLQVITDVNRNNPIRIEGLTFNIKRDFSFVNDNNKKKLTKVCDFRVNSNDFTKLIVHNKTNKTIDTLSHSQYNVLNKNTLYNLKAYNVDPNKEFAYWDTKPDYIAEEYSNGNQLNIDIDIFKSPNIRIKPVFIDPKEKLPGSSSTTDSNAIAAKTIDLFSEPDAKSEVEIKVPYSEFVKNSKITKEITNGLQKVYYGLETFFVKPKELEK